MKDAVREKGKGDKRDRTYVLDTTVVLYDPDVFYRLQGRIVIPTSVIKEIDGLKRRDDNAGYAARKAARTLDVLGSYEEFGVHGDLATGVSLSTGGIILVYPFYEVIDALDSEADNRVVGTALNLKNNGARNITLLASDINMRTVARAYGIRTRHYPAYTEDIAESAGDKKTTGNRAYLVGCSLGSEDIDDPTKRHFLLKAKEGDDNRESIWFKCFSPRQFIQRIFRFVLRGPKEDLFWLMDADWYRLCVEYSHCGVTSSKKERMGANNK